MFNFLFLNRVRRLERFLKESPEPTEPNQDNEDHTIWYTYKIDPATNEVIYSK
jgi:hypothetical protein